MQTSLISDTEDWCVTDRLDSRLKWKIIIGREKGLGLDHRNTPQSVHDLGVTLHSLEKYREAENMHRRALVVREKTLGRDHRDTLQSARDLAGREKPLGIDHRDPLLSVNNVGTTLCGQRKYGEAEDMHRRALEGREKTLGLDHRDMLLSVRNLGVALHFQEKYSEAENMHRRALAGREKTVGIDHRDTLQSANNLDSAWPMKVRPDHRDTLQSANNLIVTLHCQGKYKEAEFMYRRAVTGADSSRARPSSESKNLSPPLDVSLCPGHDGLDVAS
ncbi:hypothetical protein HOY80DRAFT_1055121 [Tuber brumale]|nr:hypothetical protein HOY80DRAFT_1055121 [Tuber brumale]